jgi:hypothetical protein
MKLTDYLDDRFIIPDLKAEAKKKRSGRTYFSFALKHPGIKKDNPASARSGRSWEARVSVMVWPSPSKVMVLITRGFL